MSEILKKVKKAGRDKRISMWYKVALSILTISFILLIISFVTGSYMEQMNYDSTIFEWSIIVNFFTCTISAITVILFHIWVDKKILE